MATLQYFLAGVLHLLPAVLILAHRLFAVPAFLALVVEIELFAGVTLVIRHSPAGFALFTLAVATHKSVLGEVHAGLRGKLFEIVILQIQVLRT